MKKRKMLKPTCGYCSTFRESTIRRPTGRYCKLSNRNVLTNAPICKAFTLHNSFWCDRKQYWLAVDACLENINIKKYGCTTCKQGKLIRRMKKKYE